MTPSPTLALMAVLPTQHLKKGDGFQAVGVRGSAAQMDPYLMVDHYRMSQPTFGPHPHAGFSAVTYMFEDAQTGFVNRDSLGDHSTIRPGDLHWTTAGAGVVHDEVPQALGQVAHGLQIFVNLSASNKHMAPGSIHLPREHMPVFHPPGGARVTLVFGGYDDGHAQSAAMADFPTQATLLDVTLPELTMFSYPVPAGHTAFVLVVSGAVQANGHQASAGQALEFARDGGALQLAASQAAQVAVFMGQPLNEPVLRQGPFAMTNQADLDVAVADFQAGRMGRL